MLESKKQGLEESIIKYLLNHEVETLVLCDQLKKQGIRGTVQGIYRIVRKLLQEGVVVKTGKKISVSREWADRVIKLLSTPDILPDMSIGDSMVYTFKDIGLFDAYWKHLMGLIHPKLNKETTLLYVPHSFWMYVASSGSEDAYYLGFAERKVKACLLIGGNTIFDKIAKKKFENPYVAVHAGDLLIGAGEDHLAIIADYIIISRIRKSVAEKINQAYRIAKTEDELQRYIHDILQKKQMFKIILERNPAKAAAFRKRMGKYFILD